MWVKSLNNVSPQRTCFTLLFPNISQAFVHPGAYMLHALCLSDQILSLMPFVSFVLLTTISTTARRSIQRNQLTHHTMRCTESQQDHVDANRLICWGWSTLIRSLILTLSTSKMALVASIDSGLLGETGEIGFGSYIWLTRFQGKPKSKSLRLLISRLAGNIDVCEHSCLRRRGLEPPAPHLSRRNHT